MKLELFKTITLATALLFTGCFSAANIEASSVCETTIIDFQKSAPAEAQKFGNKHNLHFASTADGRLAQELFEDGNLELMAKKLGEPVEAIQSLFVQLQRLSKLRILPSRPFEIARSPEGKLSRLATAIQAVQTLVDHPKLTAPRRAALLHVLDSLERLYEDGRTNRLEEAPEVFDEIDNIAETFAAQRYLASFGLEMSGLPYLFLVDGSTYAHGIKIRTVMSPRVRIFAELSFHESDKPGVLEVEFHHIALVDRH